jgi:hypothetical protein
MSADDVATSEPPPGSDRYVASWQGGIAAAARGGGDLYMYKAVLEAVKRYATDAICEAAKRHLVADVHGGDVLNAIQFSTFPAGVEQSRLIRTK